MSKKIQVILYGLGSMGALCGALIAARADYEIVGAIDKDPVKLGMDLADILGLSEKTGIKVSNKAGRVLGSRAQLVIHATGSYLPDVSKQLEQIVKAGKNVVSTCEELAEPWAQHPAIAEKLNALAKKNRVTVVGAGVNPGFAMDTLPLTLTALCAEVKSVRVKRVVDASRRRLQLQKKIGTGLTAEAFRQAVQLREVRHVGLTESVALLARGLGWTLDQVQEDIEPALASRRIVTDHYTVDPNFVTGIKQIGRGIVRGQERLRLELEMHVDADESYDEAWIEGVPNLHYLVNGIHGDTSTAAVIANTARRAVKARPGLLTMLDLPLVSSR